MQSYQIDQVQEENSDTDDFDAFYNDRSFLNAGKSYLQNDPMIQ